MHVLNFFVACKFQKKSTTSIFIKTCGFINKWILLNMKHSRWRAHIFKVINIDCVWRELNYFCSRSVSWVAFGWHPKIKFWTVLKSEPRLSQAAAIAEGRAVRAGGNVTNTKKCAILRARPNCCRGAKWGDCQLCRSWERICLGSKFWPAVGGCSLLFTQGLSVPRCFGSLHKAR